MGVKTQLKINGEMKDVEIENGEITIIEPEKKTTGWERAEKGTGYICISVGAGLCPEIDSYVAPDNVAFRTANYFTNDKLAENINRMQTLQRQMLRWQAENDVPIDFDNAETGRKYGIFYDITKKSFSVNREYGCTVVFASYFSSKEKAQECIEVFKDELTWLFTEFKWRMDG